MRRDAQDAVSIAVDLTLQRLKASMRDQRALAHAIEQVGEAAARLSPGFRDAHPKIPWRRIVGVRNRLAHDYAGTDWEIMWMIVNEAIPELLQVLDELLPIEDTEPSM